MSKAIEITTQTFKDAVEKNGILILDFWAEWCGPCKSFAPIFDAAAAENADIVFGKVNTDIEQELSAAFEIRSIPTLMVFREKVLLYAQPGALPRAALDELIKKVRELDMAKVHADVAAQEKAGKS